MGKDISRLTSCEEFWKIQSSVYWLSLPHSCPAQRSQLPAPCATGEEFLAFGTSRCHGETLQQHHWVILTGPEFCCSSQGSQSKCWTIILYVRRYQVQRVLTSQSVNFESHKTAPHPSPCYLPVLAEEAPTTFQAGRISVQLLVYSNCFIPAALAILRGWTWGLPSWQQKPLFLNSCLGKEVEVLYMGPGDGAWHILMSGLQPHPTYTLNIIVPARGILPNKQLEELQSPFEGTWLEWGGQEGGKPALCVYPTSASLLCARLGRVNQGSTAPEDPGCCSMQIGLFLFLLLIAITQSCACNKLP